MLFFTVYFYFSLFCTKLRQFFVVLQFGRIFPFVCFKRKDFLFLFFVKIVLKSCLVSFVLFFCLLWKERNSSLFAQQYKLFLFFFCVLPGTEHNASVSHGKFGWKRRGFWFLHYFQIAKFGKIFFTTLNASERERSGFASLRVLFCDCPTLLVPTTTEFCKSFFTLSNFHFNEQTRVVGKHGKTVSLFKNCVKFRRRAACFFLVSVYV